MIQPRSLHRANEITSASPRRPILGAARSLGALTVALVVFASCASGGPARMEKPSSDYLQAVRQLEAEGAQLEVDSEAERLAIERFQLAMSDIKASDLRQRIRAAYADDVYYNDTLKTFRGLAAVEEYLLATAHEVEETSVTFLDVVTSEGNYYFRWQSTLRAKKLAKGEPIESVGMTHVRFNADGRVVLHKDYWDAAGAIYEHVPVVGWLVRRVKKKL